MKKRESFSLQKTALPSLDLLRDTALTEQRSELLERPLSPNSRVNLCRRRLSDFECSTKEMEVEDRYFMHCKYLLDLAESHYNNSQSSIALNYILEAKQVVKRAKRTKQINKSMIFFEYRAELFDLQIAAEKGDVERAQICGKYVFLIIQNSDDDNAKIGFFRHFREFLSQSMGSLAKNGYEDLIAECVRNIDEEIAELDGEISKNRWKIALRWRILSSLRCIKWGFGMEQEIDSCDEIVLRLEKTLELIEEGDLNQLTISAVHLDDYVTESISLLSNTLERFTSAINSPFMRIHFNRILKFTEKKIPYSYPVFISKSIKSLEKGQVVQKHHLHDIGAKDYWIKLDSSSHRLLWAHNFHDLSKTESHRSSIVG